MTKHMINTLIITGLIYISLLLVIKYPIAMALIQDDVESTKTNPEKILEKINYIHANDVQSKATTVKDSEYVVKKVEPKRKAVTEVKPSIKNTIKETKPLKNEAIIGLTQRVDLNSAEGINALWLKFQGMSHLQNHVRWDKAPIVVYAYYSNFNADFTQANLSLGYRHKDVQFVGDNLHRFTLPTTTAKEYGFNSDNTSASDAAWAAAYQFNNLVEEYWLDSQGNIQSQNAFVYQ